MSKVCLFTPFEFRRFQKAAFLLKKRTSIWVFFHQKHSSQNEQSLLFQAFRASRISKDSTFLKICLCVLFHHADWLQKEEHLNVRLLLTNTVNNSHWVGYTFVEKPSSFQFLSILEEFCGSDFINGTSKCKTFVDKWCKQQSLGGLYLRRKAKLFPVSQHFRRNLWHLHHHWNI